MTVTTYTFVWQDITIQVSHNDSWCHIKHLGVPVQHLEIRREDEGWLPITETGYRSVFITNYQDAFLLKNKGVVDFVRNWIDLEGQSEAWKNYTEAQKQLDFF